MCFAEYKRELERGPKGKELITPEWRDTYEKRHALLWSELVDLNHHLFYLERIADFPWRLLCDQHNHFWESTYFSMYETSLLMAQRVAFDTNKKTLTLERFAKKILDHLVGKPADRKCTAELEDYDFENPPEEVVKIKERLKFVRDKRLAHLSPEILSKNLQDRFYLALVPVRDLRAIVQYLNDAFQKVSLGVGCAMTLPDLISYSQPSHEPAFDPDIAKLLDLVAKNSVVLNMPEAQPKFWPHYRRANLSVEDIRVLNEWRVRFGLPAV
jgi:hypothetical protein